MTEVHTARGEECQAQPGEEKARAAAADGGHPAPPFRARSEGAGARSTPPESPGCPRVSPGLYLHVPFCSAICPYCDFAVLTGGPRRRAQFVEGLLAEIGLWGAAAASWPAFDTIYLGGGTPSALAPEELGRIL